MIPNTPSKEEMRTLGVGFVFSYVFLGGLNLLGMTGVSWVSFSMSTGAAPIVLSPFEVDTRFVALFSGVYFSYGTLASPFVLGGAVALASRMNNFFLLVQDVRGVTRVSGASGATHIARTR